MRLTEDFSSLAQEKKTGVGERERDTARRVKFVVDAVAGTRDDELS